MSETLLSWPLIAEARARIAGKVHVTPVLTSQALDELAGAQLYFKCENLQKGGAFKARGASNAVFALSDEAARRGVATHSSGNHAAALSRAARLRGIPAYIVMPNNSAQSKRAAVERYDDLLVMAGQGTAAVELLEQVPDLDVLLAPVGGGGLLSGCAVAAKALRPVIRVIGVEPAGADDAARSFRAGTILPSVNPQTIADGLRSSLGVRP